MEYKEEAIRHGQLCPYCGEEECVQSEKPMQADANQAMLDVYCLECKEKWTEYYKMIDIGERRQTWKQETF